MSVFVEERLRWIDSKLALSLSVKTEQIKALFLDQTSKDVLLEFLNNEDVRRLYVGVLNTGSITVSLNAVPETDKSLVFLKGAHVGKIRKDACDESVVLFDLSQNSVEQIEGMMDSVFVPLMLSEDSHKGEKMMENLHKLASILQITAGNERGDVVLPVPLLDVLLESATVSNSVIVILETTVISWTKQIRAALKLELEKVLKAQNKIGPLAELKVWEKRQEMLNSILSQLESRLAAQILKELASLGNVYAKSFTLVIDDIKQALSETEDNIMYLRPIAPYLVKLANISANDKAISTVAPIVHLLDLIWRHSRFYHEPKNFKRLLRHLSALVVSSAHRFVGPHILSDTENAYCNLKHALRLCAKFRGCYLDKREKCNEYNKQKLAENNENKKSENGMKPVSGPFITMHMKRHHGMFSINNADTTENDPDVWGNSPWPARNAAPFSVLNSFMERANDVLDLVHTAQHFKNLESVAEIGGVGNKSLDTIVTEIHSRFNTAMENFMTLTEQNVLDVSKQDEEFEQEFFEFRALVRDLEAQMAHVMRICFDRCANTSAHIRLLEVFAGVSGRESVQKALADKLKNIVSGMMEEVLNVKDILDRQANIPSHRNVPDTASHMCWLRALKQRIHKPMEKLRQTIPELLNNDDGWKLRVQYDSVIEHIDSAMLQVEKSWRKEVDTELTSKLTHNLYVNIGDGPLIKVNLDRSLLLVLKEVQFVPNPDNVPPAVRSLLEQVDTNTLKLTAARLETIATHYNKLRSKIRPHEEQLFTAKIGQIEALLKQGKSSLTWKSLETDDFIEEATSLILEDCYKKLQAVQTAQSQIEAKVDHWHQYLCQSLFTSDQPCFIEDWIVKQKEVSEGYAVLANLYGTKINSVVSEVHRLLQISENSPAWHSYILYLDNLISSGLTIAMKDALTQLYNLISLKGTGEQPKILVKVELVGGMVQYHPPIDKESADTSVQEMVFNWVTQMVEYCELIPRLIPQEASYAKVIGSSLEIKELVDKIQGVMEDNRQSCQQLQEHFMKYSYLWKDDAHHVFAQFINGRSLPTSREASEDGGVSRNGSRSMMSNSLVLGQAERNFLAPSMSTGSGSIGRVPTLDDFDKKISTYQSAFDTISSCEDEAAIGWLCVDVKPVKQVLLTHASRWVYVFTEYLIKQCNTMLGNIEEFLLETEPQIETLIKTLSASPADAAIAPSAYMQLVELFNKVTNKQQEFDSRFGVVRKTVVLLNKYNFRMEKEDFFLAAPSRWSNLRAKVVLAKQRIAPKMQLRAEQISHDLRGFAKQCQSSREEFAGCEAFLRTCGFQTALELIKKFKVKVSELEDRSRNLVELQELLEAHIVDFTCISEFRNDIETLEKVWNTSNGMKAHHSLWRNGQWKTLNLVSISHETECQILELKSLPKNAHSWDVYCGLMENIEQIMACIPLIKSLSNSSMRPRHWKILVRTLGAQHSIVPDKFQEASLKDLIDMGMLSCRDEIITICQRAETDVQMEFSLQNCEEVWISKVFDLKPVVRKRLNGDYDSNARVELAKSNRESQMIGSFSEGKSRAFSVTSKDSKLTEQNSYKESEPVSTLTDTDLVFECLWHHEMILDSIMTPGSAFSDDISKWQKKLQTVEQALKTWVSVQTKWLEMEEMFSLMAVIMALNSHSRVYAHIDLEFTQMMKSVAENPNIVQQCCKQGILATLKAMLEKLATCELALIDFTHKQCSRFSRFYFLSAKDVFHLICHGHDMPAISSYISRLLPSVSSLQVDPDAVSQAVVSISSFLGETLPLQEPVPTDVEVFEWLSSLLDVMKSSVTADLADAVKSAVFEFADLTEEHWIFQFTTESVLLSVRILLGHKLREAYKAHVEGSKESLTVLQQDINLMIGVLQQSMRVAGEELRPRLVAEEDVPPSDDDLPASVSQNHLNQKRKLSLAEEDEHDSDIADGLQFVPHQLEKVRNMILSFLELRNLIGVLQEEPASANSFTLKTQLCYSYSENALNVSVVTKSFKYGYEYQGTYQRIVSTPSTDRARLALFWACHAYNGAVLLSERGQGKSESVRDISRCLGETLYMFSVTAATSLDSVKDICLGMASSGCHVCLEGMPSLVPGVLSLLVVAVRNIMAATSKGETSVKVLDQDISVKSSGRCFGTSLSSGSVNLPESIQGIFRLVTVTLPEEKTIYEALLLAHGFKFAGELSSKLVSLLNSFKALVHSSIYSLNNVKAWFVDAADRREYVSREDMTLEREEEVLMLAIRDILMPRLSQKHVLLLQQLFKTHYPAVNFSRRSIEEELTMTESRLQVALQSSSDLLAPGKCDPAIIVDPNEALVSVLKDCGIAPSVPLLARLSQLALLLSTQKIVIVVGEPGSGKTSYLNAVSQAHRAMGTPVNVENIATQALKSADLFGCYPPESGIWEDGIFTLLLKQFSSLADSDGFCWLVLDGPVSPVQLDTLATILHSDSTLLLPNSSRVKAAQNVRIIWEMNDLSSLSPTTCATAGVFVLAHDPTLWKKVLEQELTRHDSEKLTRTAKEVLGQMKSFVKSQKIEFALQITSESVVMTFSAIIQSLVHQHSLETAHIDCMVLYAAAWAYGAVLQEESRTRFNEFVLKTWPFPQARNSSTIWDVILVDHCNMMPESPNSPTSGLSNEANTGIPFLHTHSMKRQIHVMNLCTNAQRPVLLIGELGVGKTILLREKLRNTQALEGLQVTLNCDNFTDGYVLSDRLHEHTEWKAANYYDPKNSKYLICFIDNINMAKVEPEGQMTLSETIRQHIDHTFIFNKSSMSLNHLRNTVYNVTCGLNHKLSPRFIRHFAAFALHYQDKPTLQSIFTAVTKCKLSSCTINPSKLSEMSEDRLSQEEITPQLVDNVIKITIDIQDRLRTMYLPTKERCHYLFTFRTISNIFRNLLVSLKPKDNTAKDLLLLWTHEMRAGYSYRMINSVDKERFQQTFAMSAKKHFGKEDYVSLCINQEQPLFSSIVGNESYQSYEGGEGTLKEYRAMPDSSSVVERMEHNVSEFTKHVGCLDINLYDCTISLISRVVHVLSNPHDIGHVLLVADGCCDMANKIACLAASILGATVVSPTYSPDSPSSYSLSDFCADFTSAIVEAGVKGKKITFLLQEHEASDPAFLVHVSEYVSSCSVAGLFSAEEQVNIGNSLRSDLTQAGISFNHEIAFQFFLKNVQDNLRVVMTTSTTNTQLWEWSTRYPSMLNCINVMWLPHWHSDQLIHVSKYHLAGINDVTEKEVDNLAHLLTNIHKSSDGTFHNSDFENFVKKFVKVYTEESVVLKSKRKHLEKSLACIRKVSSHADVLEARLAREATVLVEKDEGVNNILVQLGRDTAIIEAHKFMLSQQQYKVAQIQQALPQLEIQRKRFEADSRNIKNTIKDTLNQLTSNSLTELRSINKPDSNIEDIIVAVIMLLKSPMADLTWNKGGKRLLAGIDRLIELLHLFDEAPLPDKALESVTQLLGSQAFAAEFQEKDHAISCVPILSLWTVGVVKYHVQLLNKVQPAIMRLEKATQALEIAKQKLTVMESKINVLQERLDGLQGSYEQATIDKDTQNSQTVDMRHSLCAATSFTEALQSMEDTWSKELDSIPLVKVYLEGSAAIAAACTVYMGKEPYRGQMKLPTEKWLPCLSEHSIPVELSLTEDFTSTIVSATPGFVGKGSVSENMVSLSSIFTLIAKESDLLKWDTRYGPTQAHLLGIVSSQFSDGQDYRPKFPLLIDPDGVACQRIQELEADNKLVTIDVSSSESRAVAALGRAISLGLPTILQNIGRDIPPVIYHLFEQRRHQDGDVETIKMGGQKFQYNRKFRLYLATAEPEDKISKTLLSYTPVVQFTLNPSLVQELLQTALLAILFPTVGWVEEVVPQKIAIVSAELEQASRLLTEKLDQEVETDIQGLNTLLLQQDQLNVTLANLVRCKEKCASITDALSPIIKRCTTLHTAIQSLTQLNSKYIIPFKTFKSWIVESIESTQPPQTPQVKQADISSLSELAMLELLESIRAPEHSVLDTMLQTVTSAIWDRVSMSVFKTDCLVISVLFSFMVTTDITDMPHAVYQVLTNNVTEDDPSLDLGVDDRPDWVSSKAQWRQIGCLEQVPALKGLSQMIDNSWVEWLEDWRLQPSPGIWHATRSEVSSAEAGFYDLLLLHVLQPLRVREALLHYVRQVQPTFSSPGKMYSLSDIGDGRPLLILYDKNPNKLMDYLEKNLVDKESQCNIVTVGSNTSDLNELFLDEGCLVLHKVQLGSKEWLTSVHQQLDMLNRKLEFAAQGVMGLLNALGSLNKQQARREGITKCILTVEQSAPLPDGLVKLCNVISLDTLIPPLDELHLPSLCSSNLPSADVTSKTMLLAVLHSILQQYWSVCKSRSIMRVSLTIAIQETRDIDTTEDIVNILTKVVYASVLETEQERQFVTCLARRIFSSTDSILLDTHNPVLLPSVDASWDEWVEQNIPIFLNFVGLSQANIEEKILCRNKNLLEKLGNVLKGSEVITSSYLSPLVLVQRRIVEYMEVVPGPLPVDYLSTPAVGSSPLFDYWLSLEKQLFARTRDTISRDLASLHAKLIQGCSTLSESDLVIYNAIYRNTPPTRWLYPDLCPGILSNESWLTVLLEARTQLATLHEGGGGIWAGCLGHLRVLFQCLLQEKAETVPISEVKLKINLLDNVPARERTQVVAAKGGLLLSGIKLVRAGWDMTNQMLVDGEDEYYPGLVHVYPTTEANSGETYSCPLFLDQKTPVTIAEFELNTKVPSSHWSLLAVCLVISREKNNFQIVKARPLPESSSLFDIQSREHILANKVLIRTSPFAAPGKGHTPTSSRTLNSPAELSSQSLQPTPPAGSKPSSRRKSVASQILERKSQPRSRNGSRSVSPLLALGRKSNAPERTSGLEDLPGSETGDKSLLVSVDGGKLPLGTKSGDISPPVSITVGESTHSSITGDKSHLGPVTGGKSPPGSITGGKSVHDSATGEKSPPGSITGGKSVHDSVSGGMSPPGSITRGKSVHDSATGENSPPGSITGGKSVHDSVIGDITPPGSITGAKSTSGSVPGDKSSRVSEPRITTSRASKNDKNISDDEISLPPMSEDGAQQDIHGDGTANTQSKHLVLDASKTSPGSGITNASQTALSSPIEEVTVVPGTSILPDNPVSLDTSVAPDIESIVTTERPIALGSSVASPAVPVTASPSNIPEDPKPTSITPQLHILSPPTIESLPPDVSSEAAARSVTGLVPDADQLDKTSNLDEEKLIIGIKSETPLEATLTGKKSKPPTLESTNDVMFKPQASGTAKIEIQTTESKLYTPETGARSKPPSPETGTGIRSKPPSPEPGTGIRSKPASPEAGTGIRSKPPSPETGTGISSKPPSPETGTGIRSKPSSPETGTGIRSKPASPEAGTGIRSKPASPEAGTGIISKPASPEAGTGIRSKPASPEAGTGIRSKLSSPEIGTGIRSKPASPETGTGIRSKPASPDVPTEEESKLHTPEIGTGTTSIDVKNKPKTPETSAGRRSKTQTPETTSGRRSKPQTPETSAGRRSKPQTPETSAGKRSKTQTPETSAGRRSKPQTPQALSGRRSKPQTPETTSGRRSKPQTPETSAGIVKESEPPTPAK